MIPMENQNNPFKRRDFLFYSLKKRNFIPQRFPSLEDLKKEYISYLMRLTRNNVRETAEILDISPDSLKQELKDSGLQ